MSSNQHAYTKGKSVETRLHSLVIAVEIALHIKEYVLGVFVEISGAFNIVKTDGIMDRPEATNTDPAISLWIINLLSCRRIHSEWGLIKRFERRAPKITAYADDVGIIIKGVCPSTLSSIMESTFREVGLSINADKTGLILFTKRYKVPKSTPRKLTQPD